MIKDTITQDLKEALLARDAVRTTVLRGLKSVILDAEIASGKRDSGLTDQEVTALLQKETKKRQESADLYLKVGEADRANVELGEKAIIERYLPAQLSEEDIRGHIRKAIAELEERNPRAMGQVIASVKAQTKGAADGAVIARITKEELNS